MSFKSSLFAALLAASSLAQAGVVYNETVQGDAPSTAGAASVGAVVTLTAGANEILGQYSYAPNDFDDYIFTVNAGATVTGISFQVFDKMTGMFNADLYRGQTHIGSFTVSNLDVNGSVNAFDGLPLSAGSYRIDHRTVSQNLAPVDYRWTIQLNDPSQVPEPATLGLLGIALAGMGAARRRAMA